MNGMPLDVRKLCTFDLLPSVITMDSVRTYWAGATVAPRINRFLKRCMVTCTFCLGSCVAECEQHTAWWSCQDGNLVFEF
jgi:hypothetical protein